MLRRSFINEFSLTPLRFPRRLRPKRIFLSPENFLDRMKIRNNRYLSRLTFLHALKAPFPVERKVRSRHKKFDDRSLVNFVSNILNPIFSYLNEKKFHYDGIIEGKTDLDVYVKANFNNFAYYLVLDFVHLSVSLDTNQTESNNLTMLNLFLYVFIK